MKANGVVKGQLSLDSWFGKMFPEHSAQTKERTSEPSWKKWQGLAKAPSLFLDLRTENGQHQVSSSETHSALLGESSMPKIGECHNAEEESVLLPILTDILQQTSSSINNTEMPSIPVISHLSEILEKNTDPKYNLSARACQGILNRAERRGKKLPQMLSKALNQVILRSQCKTEKDVPGGGKGFLIQEESATSLRCNNYMTVFQPCNWDGTQTSPTLTRNNAGGCQRMPDKDNFNCVISLFENHPQDSRYTGPLNIVPTVSAKYGTGGNNQPFIVKAFRKQAHPRNAEEGQGYEQTESCDTLNTSDNTEARTTTVGVRAETFERTSIGSFAETDLASAIRCRDYKDASDLVVSYQDATGPLCATDYKGVKNEVAENDKLVGQRACDGTDVFATTNASFHMNPQKDCVGTLRACDYKDAPCVFAVDLTNLSENQTNGSLQVSAEHNTKSNNVVRIQYIVRRLTPRECERLQGYPDDWTMIGDYTDTNGKQRKINDSVRYKALGNSIALPSWFWVLNRMRNIFGRPGTMASLFDGIGGFPLCWETINGKGSCLWASEIEEFPIAVTRKRFCQTAEM